MRCCFFWWANPLNTAVEDDLALYISKPNAIRKLKCGSAYIILARPIQKNGYNMLEVIKPREFVDKIKPNIVFFKDFERLKIKSKEYYPRPLNKKKALSFWKQEGLLIRESVSIQRRPSIYPEY